jgi:hypothetical protein
MISGQMSDNKRSKGHGTGDGGPSPHLGTLDLVVPSCTFHPPYLKVRGRTRPDQRVHQVVYCHASSSTMLFSSSSQVHGNHTPPGPITSAHISCLRYCPGWECRRPDIGKERPLQVIGLKYAWNTVHSQGVVSSLDSCLASLGQFDLSIVMNVWCSQGVFAAYPADVENRTMRSLAENVGRCEVARVKKYEHRGCKLVPWQKWEVVAQGFGTPADLMEFHSMRLHSKVLMPCAYHVGPLPGERFVLL